MESLRCWIGWVYWPVALVVSFAYAAFVFDIHIWSDRRAEGSENPLDKKTVAFKWHQRWFNFVGSIVGWYAAWVLLMRAIECHGTCKPYSLSLGTGITAVVALLGVTGYLPLALYSLAA